MFARGSAYVNLDLACLESKLVSFYCGFETSRSYFVQLFLSATGRIIPSYWQVWPPLISVVLKLQI